MKYYIKSFKPKREKKIVETFNNIDNALNFLLDQRDAYLKIVDENDESLYDDLTGSLIRKSIIKIEDFELKTIEKVLEKLDRPVIRSTSLNSHLTKIKKAYYNKNNP